MSLNAAVKTVKKPFPRS